jgi:Domain of unknown function (DUF4397)
LRGWVCFSGVVLLSAALIGCGSGNSGNTGELRVLHALPNAPNMEVVVDGTIENYNLGYGNATAYLSLDSGSRHVQMIPVNGTTPILDTTVSVTESVDQTLVMTGSTGSVKSLLLTDDVLSNGTTGVSGDGYVRVLNASANMGPADVYLVSAGSSLAGVQPVATALPLDKNTGYQTTPEGTYEVFMTSPGTINVLVATGPVSIAIGQSQGEYQTVVIRDGASGGVTFSLLQDQ